VMEKVRENARRPADMHHWSSQASSVRPAQIRANLRVSTRTGGVAASHAESEVQGASENEAQAFATKIEVSPCRHMQEPNL
jgi:hypothetical protein